MPEGYAEGCMALPDAKLDAVLGLLNPADRPHILITSGRPRSPGAEPAGGSRTYGSYVTVGRQWAHGADQRELERLDPTVMRSGVVWELCRFVRTYLWR